MNEVLENTPKIHDPLKDITPIKHNPDHNAFITINVSQNTNDSVLYNIGAP